MFMIFFNFFEVFRVKLFCAARCSHVVCTIRFAIKFHIGQYISGRWARLGKNGFIRKTVQKQDFTWVQIAQVHSKSNKPTLKAYQNHRTVLNSNYVYFHEKTPTHFSATYANINFYRNLQNRTPRESGQNFCIIRISIVY